MDKMKLGVLDAKAAKVLRTESWRGKRYTSCLRVRKLLKEGKSHSKGLEVTVPGAGAGLGAVPAPTSQNVEPRNPRRSG